MIVSCEHCRTQFRLDDAKVPETGARVRCSKCNHSFYIPPPGQSDDLMAAEQAREALQGASPEPDDTDSDWEFNHDAPAAEDSGPQEPPAPDPGATGGGLDAARQAVDGLLGDMAGSPPAGEEAAPEEPFQVQEDHEEESAPAQDDEPEDPEALFGTLDDDPPEDVAPPASELMAAVDEDESRDPAGLGSPESWNLLDEPGGPSDATAIGRVGTLPRWKLLEQERAAEMARAASDDQRISPLGRALGVVLGGIGWLATLGLLAFGAWGALQPAPAPATASTGKLEAPGFRALEVRGHWIENARVGPIYVVSGSLRRADVSRQAAAGPLVVRLLDARGEPIEAALTPVGPPFPERALRERNPARLQADQRRAALDFARLHPGETVPFQAVFSRIPPHAARFDLARAP